jgi:hypothetical protein
MITLTPCHHPLSFSIDSFYSRHFSLVGLMYTFSSCTSSFTNKMVKLESILEGGLVVRAWD